MKHEALKLEKLSSPQAVEQLVIEVHPPSAVERWLEADHEVWSKGLAIEPGYVRKEVWQSRERPGRLTVNIYWKDMASWKSVSTERLVELDRACNEMLAPFTAEIVEEPHLVDQNFLIAESGGLEHR